jgi:PAS domain S-box-containing protein
MHDLTEQKKAEAALRESETKYRIIAENMADVITVMDMDLNFTYVSPSIVKLRGFTVEESMEQRIDQIMTPESFQRLSDVFNEERHLEQKGTADPDRGRTIELEEYKKDGSTIWVENTASFIRNNDQKPVGILVVSRDITERKHAEEALKNSEASLKEAQRLAVIGNWSLDLRTGELSMSDQMYSIIGLEKTPDALNVATHEKHYTPESWQRFRSAAETASETGKPYEIELEVVRNGGNHHAVARGEVLKDVTGQAVVLRGTLQDITERVNLQAQLAQSQKMESVGRLAGGVAHDFNNILSIILGNTEMALEGMATDDPLHDNLSEIFSAARRSADITRQLLAFARKQTIAPKVLDLNRTIKSMLKMLRRLIGEDIDLAWLPGENIWPIRMDPSQIDQILANLFVNARDAIADVGKITIETGTATFDSAYCVEHPGFVPGDFILLAVSDDGSGMDQETQANLFEPFFTTKSVEKGTGLGLATVYGIVKQNDGFINVYSEPDQGTTFRIYLPRYWAETESPKKDASGKINLVGTETILLVEDEPSILRMTRMMLERTGYKVLAASTPGEAIALAREHAGEIHLLITDVVMPEMNGRDLAKNVLSLHPNLKRLFMSGYTANVIAHHGVLEEGVNFIQKPFSREQIGKKVREALDKDEL